MVINLFSQFKTKKSSRITAKFLKYRPKDPKIWTKKATKSIIFISYVSSSIKNQANRAWEEQNNRAKPTKHTINGTREIDIFWRLPVRKRELQTDRTVP